MLIIYYIKASAENICILSINIKSFIQELENDNVSQIKILQSLYNILSLQINGSLQIKDIKNDYIYALNYIHIDQQNLNYNETLQEFKSNNIIANIILDIEITNSFNLKDYIQ